MKRVAVTQRVDLVPQYLERRDALDQRWSSFLDGCELLPLPLPNNPRVARALVQSVKPDGFVLTGGNDLERYGGDSPERDETERTLIEFAIANSVPVIAVCRGMQAVQDYFGVVLSRIDGHIMPAQVIRIDGVATEVNSYHRFGATTSTEELEVWAVADDGVVKAVRHRTLPITGIMWHPERMLPFRAADIRVFRSAFGVA